MSGSFAILPAAAANRGLSAYDWSVIHAIALHADKDGCAFPSLSTIAKVAGVPRHKVSTSVKKLELLGLLECRRERPPGARWANTRYRIPRNSTCSGTNQPANGTQVGTIEAGNGTCGGTMNSTPGGNLTDQETDSLPGRRISIGEERLNDASGTSGETIPSRCGFYVANATGFRLCGRPTVAGIDRCAEHLK